MSAFQTYERPALRKAFAAFAADSKVANASLAVIAIVVSTSDKLPPPDAASTAEAAAFASGNSPVVVTKCQIPRGEPTSDALEELGNSLLTIFWLSQHAFDGV
jgi:hypothetical protein